ncbi:MULTISPECIES: Rrf2 family transcriptional regulator [Clostridium]|uniref:Rrf2 family transcriptional regulator n=1 Tax=Clostridium TaxID=1485 RepID=UPI00098C3518|nr:MULTISPECIES: Rrf2 family transcriptional regulator [Clostridium]AVK47556.1 Rrf2 family transcriptional regulator [Clostridium sp. MF28]MZK49083.1 Rrf2 family transcriptional regulator [Clostridium beijerinckii]MZK56914.1 Rrf2 family transcriptional regulator [Clostridium beijerinckii]MZK67125.1 Rrf2 family transcriptional regulator [Clostridium beijerinckii]MZK72751.1 Rrf2 family transcriptional regulator [Clostridium beijerinckii]
MKFSVGVEYAIHCLLYMVKLEEGKSVGIRDLATFQGISETYLSKVYAKLSKAGIIKSIPGVKGGYALARSEEEITFWDIVEAVEGSESFFQCAEIRQNNILLDKDNLPDTHTKCPCLIKVVMSEAEDEMRKYLRKKSLAWLYNEVYNKKLPKEFEKATIEWFNNSKK